MQLSDFIALLALIISIYSIWVQNKGIKQELLITNVSEYTKRYQEIFEKLPKIVLDENFNIDSLSDEDKEIIVRPVWLYFDLCYEQYLLHYELDIVDQKLWKYWEAGMVSAFSRPSFFICWNIISNISAYPRNFTNFVNHKMSQLHR
ncbi:hypothetical protein [Moorena sp. SIO3B2]|uniref:hypothetical protein n=1 Tax=Moorena sp. SIO3B2 TaxID=2607827 RepID=UPI0013C9F9E4|nr:hypothetical protein [Moorena sp. SIO3B2]NEP36268.1 hypothetical protein [Moorena sp. SIO3B2]